MARELISRLKIEGTLLAVTPLHVGGYGESFETDMALAKNGNDEFYIPGTSLAGVVRNWFENAFGENEMESLFGKKSADFASFVLIEDMPLSEQVQSELRDGVGIDRFYGTAANQAKFDRAILPKDTELKFEMCVEIENRKKKPKEKRKNSQDIWAESEIEFNKRIISTKASFGHLLEALQNGEIRIGASKTRGLGKVKLSKVETIKVQNLDDKAGILSALQNGGNVCSIQELIDCDKQTEPNTNEKLIIDITWQPKSSLMVKAGYEGIGVDTLPLTSRNGKGKVSLCLPGSSTKGVFRSHAERILRTVLNIEAPNKFDDSQNFSNQVRLLDKNGENTEEATKLIGELFGAKKEKEDKNKPKSTLGLGALSIDDCFAKKQMDATTWQDVEVGEFANEATYSTTGLHQTLRKIDLDKNSLSEEEKSCSTKEFHISHHTAIDRFTGAASDGALFSVLKPANSTTWDHLILTLDLKRISNDKAALMLLLLVLRDFAQNRLPLGFATNRGMGEVKDVSFVISGKYKIEYKNGSFIFSDSNLKQELTTAWENWRKENAK